MCFVHVDSLQGPRIFVKPAPPAPSVSLIQWWGELHRGRWGCFPGSKYSLDSSIQWGAGFAVQGPRWHSTHRPGKRGIPFKAKTTRGLLLKAVETEPITLWKRLCFCNDASLLISLWVCRFQASLHAAVRNSLALRLGAPNFSLWVPVFLSRERLQLRVIYSCWRVRTSGSCWDGDGCLIYHTDEYEPNAPSDARWL